MKNTSPLESWEQEQFFRWVYGHQIKYPELQLINGSMNGVRVGPKTMKNLKAQGLRRGIPDIDVPIARRGAHGLRIEMKRVSGGSISSDQRRIHTMLEKQGYTVCVCRGWREAVGVLINYLDIDESLPDAVARSTESPKTSRCSPDYCVTLAVCFCRF